MGIQNNERRLRLNEAAQVMSMLLSRWQDAFLRSVVIILAITATFKFLSICGEDGILRVREPLFQFVTVREFLLIGAFVELAAIAGILLLRARSGRLLIVAWLCTIFLIYRFGRAIAGISDPCPCLGTVGAWAGIGSRMLNKITGVLLVYLFGGSLVGLIASRNPRSLHPAASE